MSEGRRRKSRRSKSSKKKRRKSKSIERRSGIGSRRRQGESCEVAADSGVGALESEAPGSGRRRPKKASWPSAGSRSSRPPPFRIPPRSRSGNTSDPRSKFYPRKEPRHARFHCSGAFSAFFWLRDRQGAEFCVARRRTPSFVRSRRSQGCEAPATFGPISHGLGTLSASTAAIPACCRSSGFQASGLGRPFGPEQGTEDPSTGFKVGEPKQFAQTPSFADWSNQDCSSSFEAQIGQIGTRNRKPSSKSWRRQRQINDSRRWTQAGRFRQSDSG
ncbi:hypothetical protein L596_009608 [Steinernema carpocapsae]|uniref:Uncharacterized protein n=1 Tax=Steinernema carpocapsae TaxID=34508 RepID=A0A4U5PG53_STECR|nr:hypothetical protein L596_009608 [Steinernema carpocapsae]